jgi:hypothetical protein
VPLMSKSEPESTRSINMMHGRKSCMGTPSLH